MQAEIMERVPIKLTKVYKKPDWCSSDPWSVGLVGSTSALQMTMTQEI